jgi:hypothetical protein
MVTTPLPMFGKPEPKEPAKAEWKVFTLLLSSAA